jgi:predicted transcriptional regulator
VVITIDEVMHDENMRHFASQFQIFVRKDYPVFLLMTGLYENIYAIQNDPALTFLLRTPKISLEPLSLHQITKQYSDIFQIDVNSAKNLARITKGYAFAFQALGLLYYEHRDEMELSDILLKLDDMLDDFVYKKIWSTLTDKERKIIRAISTDDAKTGDVCKAVGINNSTFSTYREEMLSEGLIETSKYGYVSLTLPRFYEITKNYRI